MKPSLAPAAVLFSSLVAGLPSPHPSSVDSPPKDIAAVAGSTDPDHITIHFRAPCPGCFTGSDDVLELTLEIDAADKECSGSAPRLNGVPLDPANGNDVAVGQISFKSKLSDGLTDKIVNASWQSTCLKGEASMITVRFADAASHKNVKDVSGFTTSFKQTGQPTVLRLQDKPVDQIISPSDCGDWLRPKDEGLSIIPIITEPVSSIDGQLELEYVKLVHLKEEMDQLHDQMRENCDRVASLIKQEFRACSNLKCLWQTALGKAPTIKKLIALRFSHHKGRVAGCTNGEGQKACSAADQDDRPAEADLPESGKPSEEADEVHGEVGPLPRPPEQERPANDGIDEPPPQDGPEEHHHPPFEGEHPGPPFEGAPPHPPFDGEHGRPPFEGDHPHPPFGPPFRGNHPPFGPPHGPPKGMPHRPPGHHGPPPPFGPHGRPSGPPRFGPFGHGGRRHNSEIRLALAVITLILLVVLSGLAFRLLHKSAWYRDPRRQADRAARKEERRTRKLYRKAAYKHKWATWWKRYQRHRSNDDYEEKREMILEQEGGLEDVMRDEIRTLRNASDLVRDLVRVEEGRARRNAYNPHQTPYPISPAELDAGVGCSNYTHLPPSYMVPPPRYEQELEGDLTVVDGFRYTPSNTEETPESSIIDCNSRLSLDTGRSTVFTKDGRV
ncbi:hypothetical protein A1O1_07769 [Capronia coronata CBS 617.96]|uniref:Uncharacterized protein n=1 Tax=Capronia coronata CBS 617.96 TaxID=1182541 RepID=W9YHE8_9EURO|nr:uncharacterized protein A1O1_07769 [Capronia coronata CBS 617.96]EXJ81704.1 hypothetical protein A1O1_07769 [Capronia coronata CBS 617.96]